MIEYGFTQEFQEDFETVLQQVKDHLKDEGFGVLTTIDVKEKFKEKLDVDFRKYVILGACNPKLAHRVIEAEENIGLMLPCNVIVYEKDDKTVVSAIRPTVAMQMIDNSDLKPLAMKVEQSLWKVIQSLSPARATS